MTKKRLARVRALGTKEHPITTQWPIEIDVGDTVHFVTLKWATRLRDDLIAAIRQYHLEHLQASISKAASDAQ